MASTQLTQEWVLERLKAISDRCMTAVPVMEFDYVNKEMVQKTDEEGKGVWEFDSNGANKATENIGKHLGMFITKKIEHSGELPVLNFITAPNKPFKDNG
jgi:phage terminase small subunit